MMSFSKMEPDPDGLTQQVAVIMTGKVYREAGLKHSKHPEVEGLLYDRLCRIGKHKLRDDVRLMALSIAVGVRDKEFRPTVAWLDNFMRRFCLSKKNMGFHSLAMLKTKPVQKANPTETASVEKGVTQEEVFSALGFPKDFTGFRENLEQGIENGASAGASASGKPTGTENGVVEVIIKQEGDVCENTVDPLVLSDCETSAQHKSDINSSSDKTSNTSGKDTNEVQEIDPLHIENNKDMEVDPLSENEEHDEDQRDCDKNKNGKENDDDKQKDNENKTDVEERGKMKTESKDNTNDSDSNEDPDDMSTNTSNHNAGEVEDEFTSNEFGDSGDENNSKKKIRTKSEIPENDEEKESKEEDECILYSKEENNYYNKNFESIQKRLTSSVVRCSSCFEQVNHQLPSLVNTHPVLGIFLCKRCRKYYGKGKFCKDEDGYDEYCRLCAEGGDLLCCEQEGCFNGFCKRCIKRVIGRTELKDAEKAKNWACYVCNRAPLMEVRALHRAVLQNLKEEEAKKSNLSRKEVQAKEIKNKFALLKKAREEKLKDAQTPKGKTLGPKGKPWLKDIIYNLTDMLQICFNNIEKIENIWEKHNYSEEATQKTANRIVKQLDAMQHNFVLMKEDIAKQGPQLDINEPVEGGSSDFNEVSGSKDDSKEQHSKSRGEQGTVEKTEAGRKKESPCSAADEVVHHSGENNIEENNLNENLGKPNDMQESNGKKDEHLKREGSSGIEEKVEDTEEGGTSKMSETKDVEETPIKRKKGRPRKSDVREGKGDEKGKEISGEFDSGNGPKNRRGRPKKIASIESKSTEEESDNGEVKEPQRDKLDNSENDGNRTENMPKRRGRPSKVVEENPVSRDRSECDKSSNREKPQKSPIDNEESEGSEHMNREDTKDSEVNNDDDSPPHIDTSSMEVDDDDSSKMPRLSMELNDNDGEGEKPERDKLDKSGNDDNKDKNTDNSGNSTNNMPRKRGRPKKAVEESLVSSDRSECDKSRKIETQQNSLIGNEDLEGSQSMNRKEVDNNDESNITSESSAELNDSECVPCDEGKSEALIKVNTKKRFSCKTKEGTSKTPKNGSEEAESEDGDKNKEAKERQVVDKVDVIKKVNDDEDNTKDGVTEKVKTRRTSKVSLGRGTTGKQVDGICDDKGEPQSENDEKESMNDEKMGIKDKKMEKSGKVKKEEEDSSAHEIKKKKKEKEMVDVKDLKKNSDKKRKKKGYDRSATDELEQVSKQNKKKSDDSGSDSGSGDSLLGIGSDDSNDRPEKRRKKHADADVFSPKSRKTGNVKKISEKEREMKKKNKAALSSLLASDSEEDSDTKSSKVKERGKVKTGKMKTKVSESSDTDISVDGFRKKGKNKSKKSGLNDNEKAKDALLESESSDNLEDKPKPKCKKKSKLSKGSRDNDETRRYRRRSQKVKLSEEEREQLKKQQLGAKASVAVERMAPDLEEALQGSGYIDTGEYPDLIAKLEQEQDTYDGDAEEEESDREFSKLMKFDVNTKFCKPGPKSKKKFFLPDDSDDDDEESDENEEESNGSNEQKGYESKGKKPAQKKKEGLLDIDIDQDQDQDEDDGEEDSFSKKKKKGGITLNEKLKKNLLLSSDEEEEEEDDEDNEEEKTAEREMENRERIKHEMQKTRKKKKKEEGEDVDEETRKVSKKGYMRLDITSDEDDEDFKPENNDDDDVDSDFEESPRKRRTFQLSSSDSDSSISRKKKKRKKEEESDYECEEVEEETPKGKRKRIKKVSSSSDEGEEGEDGKKEESPSKHKKIRRVIRDEDLLESTKNATQEEEERRKRIAERQKQFNQIFEIDVESDQKDLDKLVLDFNPDTKKELVCVNNNLVKHLKPHQAKGVKFMWDSTIESLEMLEQKPGSGCILAHCMGLGKTLQVITYVHTLLTNKNTSRSVQRVMVCCPVNTVYNWVSEFSNWLKGKMLPFEVWELVSAKDLWARAYRLDDWWKEGGVCIMGYDMFRNLSNPKSKRFKAKMKEIFLKTLVDPGPDVMVCDEGHLLKNEKTALSKAINKIKTMRRIILTGTPLQNNLKEYHCMIQFVKPNLLGTKKEFMNRFVNPIEQGQCAEADQRDVRRMKRRAHILHNLLEGCVQRFDYTVLKPFLPPKFEYVISIQLSEIQVKLYRYYLENLAQGGPKRQGSGLFVDYGALSRVWTHPKVLELAVRRALLQDEEDDMDDFICDDSTSDESSDDEKTKRKGQKKKNNRGNDDDDIEDEVNKEEAGEPERADGTKMKSKKTPDGPLPGLTASGKVRVDWWKKVLLDNEENFEENDYLDRIEHSGKLILLLDILRESCSIGDKVLVFSQSLLALDMIEDFLQMIDQGELELPELEEEEGQEPLPIPFKKWKKDRDYLRLDGSTNADTRKFMCKTFNSHTNERCRLFLISTRAGGLGINLVAANRVIIFDSSWNPSHDSQSIFRVYRFGQKKPCYVYRFVAQGTMEEKIYSRQVTKMSTALRVVDEHQIKRYFKMADLQQLYEFTPSDKDERETPAVPEDRLLAELLKRQKDWIVNYHEHDSLLENQTSEELSEEERKAAWEDYENEKKGFLIHQRNTVMPVVGALGMATQGMHTQQGLPSLSLASFSFEGVVNTIKAQNPHLSQNELCESVVLATKQIQRIHLNHYQRVQGMVYNLKNPMIAPEQRKHLPFGNHPEMLPMLEQQLRLLEDNIQRENQVINHMTQITPQRKDNHASMMSAGLVRGQPVTAEKSFSTDYVERSVIAASVSTKGLAAASSSTQQQTPASKIPLQ
ncbi:transcriptional regulator ATRX-like isoform X3 [Macrobrachium rosenbergii]|uniref:transcriptional regulator ATRX-like isoform X3 n=1 Tax=Macrobrachium rosenbergii TaxID=79674 RepID=UPI0034D74D19